MKEVMIKQFKSACKNYLLGQSIGTLRAYGRIIGVAKSTEKKKEELIGEIIAVLLGEKTPIQQSRRGAPIKNDYIDPKVFDEIEELKKKYLGEWNVSEESSKANTFDFQEELRAIREKGREQFVFHDPLLEKNRDEFSRKIYVGQLEMYNGVACLLPIDLDMSVDKILVSVKQINEYDLREGDVVSCHVIKGDKVLLASEILTINYVAANTIERNKFEECAACYPYKTIDYIGKRNDDPSIMEKYFHWLIPIRRGQRGCIVSSPKAGKTSLIYELARSAMKNNSNLQVFVLLLDQAPEVVMQFRKGLGGKAHLLCTTYEDDCEKQVFAAEYLLKRAKRFAEGGSDVLFLIDSFNALARAYNDTDASSGGKVLAGGLESKTVYYLKKYFGAARCFEKIGSLTMLGSVCVSTGNPADNLISSELSSIANLEVWLSDELAIQHMYPAIDFGKTRVSLGEISSNAEDHSFEVLLRSNIKKEELYNMIKDSSIYSEFKKKIKG